MSTFNYATPLSALNLDNLLEFGLQSDVLLDDFFDNAILFAEDGDFAVAEIDVDANRLIKISTCSSDEFAVRWCQHPSDQYNQFTRVSPR